ncbi:MAG: hypothetical protein H8E32_09165 [Nitrospinae bacterium]|nr:hypothetical protein [Nitrospinota bacterium]
MFYDVKVLDAGGQTKKIISGQELSRLHWQMFQGKEENKTVTAIKKTKVPGWVKKKLDLEFKDMSV